MNGSDRMNGSDPMNGTMPVPRLLLLTDRSQLRLGRGLVRTVTQCVAAGLTHVLVRELDLSVPQRAALVGRLGRVDGLVVLSARTLLPGAVGVHLPADPPCNAGLWRLPQRPDACKATTTPRYSWFGRSCHDEDGVRRAAAEGAAYATLSPFAPTESKPGHGPPVPRELFGRGHGVPLLALGGITPDNAVAAREAGAHGVAVMGAVMRAADPAGLVATLLEAVS